MSSAIFKADKMITIMYLLRKYHQYETLPHNHRCHNPPIPPCQELLFARYGQISAGNEFSDFQNQQNDIHNVSDHKYHQHETFPATIDATAPFPPFQMLQRASYGKNSAGNELSDLQILQNDNYNLCTHKYHETDTTTHSLPFQMLVFAS